MAFNDLSDVMRESIYEAWDELGRAVRASEEFEAALRYSAHVTRTTGIERALTDLSASMRNGYGPTVLSMGPAEYFEGKADGDPEGLHDLAKKTVDGLELDLRHVQSALEVLRTGLRRQADELERLADLADAAIG